jgi:AraC family transcriptional regulator
MSFTILFVKNMVCRRCILTVENILTALSIPFHKVLAGEIHLTGLLAEDKQELLKTQLSATGLELIDNKMSTLIEKIKQLVIRKARMEVGENERKLNLSHYLSTHLFKEYTYLSSLFSSVEGRTIEHYFIQQRIEKVKELLVYNEMTLFAISIEMEYSSTAHLSSQFKQITGLTPSHFKKVSTTKRKLIDQV